MIQILQNIGVEILIYKYFAILECSLIVEDNALLYQSELYSLNCPYGFSYTSHCPYHLVVTTVAWDPYVSLLLLYVDLQFSLKINGFTKISSILILM